VSRIPLSDETPAEDEDLIDVDMDDMVGDDPYEYAEDDFQPMDEDDPDFEIEADVDDPDFVPDEE
jgi:hypothetical protein